MSRVCNGLLVNLPARMATLAIVLSIVVELAGVGYFVWECYQGASWKILVGIGVVVGLGIPALLVFLLGGIAVVVISTLCSWFGGK